MKNLLQTSLFAMLITGISDPAIARSCDLGSEMIRTIQSVGSSTPVARLDQEDAEERDEDRPEAPDEYESEQEARQRELDDEYRSLIIERLERDAEHHEALRELEQERARGAIVEEDYRKLMEEQREQDAEHRESIRELDRERAEIHQEFAAEAIEENIESSLADPYRPWWKRGH